MSLLMNNIVSFVFLYHGHPVTQSDGYCLGSCGQLEKQIELNVSCSLMESLGDLYTQKFEGTVLGMVEKQTMMQRNAFLEGQ